MNAASSSVPEQVLGPRAWAEIRQLEADLEGYPLEPLLDALAHASPVDPQRALLVMDCCLSSWITQLERPFDRHFGGMPDIIDRIERRQRSTHDALARVHAALRPARAMAPTGSRAG